KNKTYEEKDIIVDSDFLTSTTTIQPGFASSPLQEIPGSHEIFIPRIYNVDDNFQTQSLKEFKPRLLYHAGLINLPTESYKIDYGQGNIQTYTHYNYAGEWDHPYQPTLALNFNTPDEVFYLNRGAIL